MRTCEPRSAACIGLLVVTAVGLVELRRAERDDVPVVVDMLGMAPTILLADATQPKEPGGRRDAEAGAAPANPADVAPPGEKPKIANPVNEQIQGQVPPPNWGKPGAEAGLPGYEVQSWFGLNAPKGTPPDIIAKLNAEVGKALADKDVQARLAELGAVPTPMTAKTYDEFVKKEVAKWAPVVKASGATVD